MNKSSLDSESVKGGILKKEGGRDFVRIQATILFFIQSYPVMLKSLFWESCTDTSYYIPLLFTTLETGDEF